VPHKLPAIALGSATLLRVERAAALFAVFLLLLAMLVRSWRGELPTVGDPPRTCRRPRREVDLGESPWARGHVGAGTRRQSHIVSFQSHRVSFPVSPQCRVSRSTCIGAEELS
jgi:hypothetical protein